MTMNDRPDLDPLLAAQAPLAAQALASGSHAHYEALMRACRSLPPLRTAIVHPCDENSLGGALSAAAEGIIVPILIGPARRIAAVAQASKLDLRACEVLDVPHSHAAADKAVEIVRAARAEAIMKGSLHTDELMSAALRKENGLRTGRRVSHVFILDVPSYPKPLFLTDAVVNIAPDLEQKADIVQNAIDLARSLNVACPKVAILSAVETVSSKIPSTIDAAALCKMADRGQIVGGLLDGPLALDNAISRDAAQIKHIDSPVAGDPDVLVVPNMEAGNLLAKELIFMSGSDAAGIVLGASVPIMLTSRADSIRARTASCAVACLYARSRSTPRALATDR